MPKSVSTTRDDTASSMMLPGFRSRWTTPAACAASSPAAICVASGSADAVVKRGPRASRAASVSPDQQLHGEEEPFTAYHHLRADVEDPADVGVGDLARRLDLAPEALALDAVARQLRGQRLQGDRAAQGAVLGLVHLAGASGAEEAHDPVAAGDQIAARERSAAGPALPPTGASRVGHARDESPPRLARCQRGGVLDDSFNPPTRGRTTRSIRVSLTARSRGRPTSSASGAPLAIGACHEP